MIDFGALVLGPCMNTFARPCIVTPLVSQPGMPAYPARGIWSIAPGDMLQPDGTTLATDICTFGVRAADFVVVPLPGDRVEIPEYMTASRIGLCRIEDDGDDGQGGFAWILKKIGP